MGMCRGCPQSGSPLQPLRGPDGGRVWPNRHKLRGWEGISTSIPRLVGVWKLRKSLYTMPMQMGSPRVCHTTILPEELCKEGDGTHVSVQAGLSAPGSLHTHLNIM